MKALTLTQPWATLVAIGAKRIETRSWTTHYRGPLAIHAAKTWTEDDIDCCWDPPFREALRGWVDFGAYSDLTSWSHERFQALPFGAIVAVVDLFAVSRVVRADPDGDSWLDGGHLIQHGTPEEAFGNYDVGRYGWRFANIRALPTPIPARGFQGLWTVPPEIEAQLAR